ncbi:MAG: hypothetical protein B6U69_01335 [Thermofilum sp. ex4484_15]|nr:MAG: hypothetical protein B6U69_01335 [Thermofilum sp. ex4484_15]
MGRKRLPSTINRAINIYRLLLSLKEPTSTPELLKKALNTIPGIDYSSLYQGLRLLRNKGVVEQKPYGKTSYWKVVKVLNEEELREILSK